MFVSGTMYGGKVLESLTWRRIGSWTNKGTSRILVIGQWRQHPEPNLKDGGYRRNAVKEKAAMKGPPPCEDSTYMSVHNDFTDVVSLMS